MSSSIDLGGLVRHRAPSLVCERPGAHNAAIRRGRRFKFKEIGDSTDQGIMWGGTVYIDVG
jgi:hypothetical protein